MSIGLAIGLVINIGGLLGQGNSTSGDESGDGITNSITDGLSDIADSIGGIFDERRMLQVPWYNIPKFLMMILLFPAILPTLVYAANPEIHHHSWYQNFAFYIGPVIDIKFIYFTAGICIGGFGCAAGGGGIKLGNFGIGVLFPFWKWW